MQDLLVHTILPGQLLHYVIGIGCIWHAPSSAFQKKSAQVRWFEPSMLLGFVLHISA